MQSKSIDRQGNRLGSEMFFSLLRSREVPIMALVVVLSLLLTIASPYFMTYANIRATFIGLSIEVILMIGVSLSMIGGGVDISVGSVLGLGSACVGVLMSAGLNPWVACLATVAVTTGVGAANGCLITRLKIPAMIVTLGTFNVARGAAYVLTQGVPATGFPDSFGLIGQGSVGRLPISVIIAAVLLLLATLALRHVTFFHQLYFIGNNPTAARLSGIDVDRVTLAVYSISGFLAGVAGIIMASRLGCAQPSFGEGFEFRVITAALIGGISLSGGKGRLQGAAVGALFMALVNNAMILVDISIFWQKVAVGSLLLLAVIIDRLVYGKQVG